MLPFRLRWGALERARDRLTETQADALRLGAIALGLAALGAGAYHFGAPYWRRWQGREARIQARRFAREGDVGNLTLALRRAVELAPNDPASWNEAARDLGEIGSPDAVIAREALVRLAPRDASAKLALARTAVRFGRYDLARAALRAAQPAARGTVAYERAAVALAVAVGNLPDTRRELARLIALDPADANARFTYAALRLWHGDPDERAVARAELRALMADRGIRIRATIELLSEAARRHDAVRMHEALARALQLFEPSASFTLRVSDVDAWNALLVGMKAEATRRPDDAALLARWLADMGRRPQALAWLQGLPASTRDAAPVASMAAQLAAEAGDDRILAARLRAGAWGPWPERAWTLAIAAHRGAEGGGPAGGWREAIVACGNSLDGLRNLARLAQAWDDAADAEASWMAILNRDPGMAWAYDALRASYEARHEDAALLDLYARRVRRFPTDEAAAARWIVQACLMNRAGPAVFAQADRLAPDAPEERIAKAAAFWRRGRLTDAERMLNGLPAGAGEGPSAVFWSALIESDLGHDRRARSALAAAWRTGRSAAETALLEAGARRVGFAPNIGFAGK
ncbi:MAG: hypothetical protein ACREFX_07290 [Opitutaceae bacterium]